MPKNNSPKHMTSAEVTQAMLPPARHVEVREKQNGSWVVVYPDPGFIPCAPACDLGRVMRNHKHEYEPSWIETNYKPESYADALEWATLIAEGREVKTVPFTPLAERRKKKLEAVA